MAAHAVSHHRQEGLLQPVRHRPVGCRGGGAEPNDTRIVHSGLACLPLAAKTSTKSATRGTKRGDFTVKVAPAGDVTGRPGGEDLPGLRETGHPHTVGHDGALVQLQQGEVVAGRQTNVVRQKLTF